jgi:hypothetical protein
MDRICFPSSPPLSTEGEAEDLAQNNGGKEEEPAGATRSRSRGNLALSLFVGGGDLKIWLNGRRYHAQATAKIQIASPTPMLEVNGGAPPGDSAPNLNTKRTPTLLEYTHVWYSALQPEALLK